MKAIATILDLEREYWLRMRNSGEIVWKTKKGEYIPIKDMEDIHVIRTIWMLRKQLKDKEELELLKQIILENEDSI